MVMGLIVAVSGYSGRTNALANGETYMSVAYTINPGETLYSISKKFYLTGDYEQVAQVNGWNSKASLKAGTTVQLANPLVLEYCTVKPGETLYAIANRYFNRNQYMGVLMTYNRIADPNTGLKAGTAIRIPLPAGEAKHTVQKGDTLYSLSARYFKAPDYQTAIAEANGITAATGAIKAGQTLRIPNPYYMAGSGAIVSGAVIGGSAAVSSAASTAATASAAGSGTPAKSAVTTASAASSSTPAKSTVATASVTGSATPAKSAVATASTAKTLTIEINITLNKLYVRLGGTVEKSFDVASGKRAGLTPTGSFEIVTKIRNPWYSAKGIPGGDPKNPLGSRWLGLSVPNTQGMTYGIHGTNAPASIGTNASAGCIRMHNEDVEWLFDAVPTGTKVTIKA